MKDGRNSNFIMLPLYYSKSRYGVLADTELSKETLADLIDYADTHDLKWEYKDAPHGQKYWHVWDDSGFIHGVKMGRGIAKVLKKYKLGLATNFWGNLVLCEVTG